MTPDPYASCPYPPRSLGKLAWLEARFNLRLPLFVPGDAGAEAEPGSLPAELFARLVPTPEWDGLLSEPAARQLVAEVFAGQRSAVEVAALVGVTPMAVRCAVANLHHKERRVRTA